MAFTKSTAKTTNISEIANKPTQTASQLKALFDKYSSDDKTFTNGLIDELEKTTAGSSGAENIGSASIAGVSGNTVHAQLTSIKGSQSSLDAQNVKLTGTQNITGTKVFSVNPQVPTPTAGNHPTTMDYVTGVSQSLQSQIVNAQTTVDLHKAIGNHNTIYYTKTNMQTSGEAALHWDNLTNKPNFADASWKPSVANRAALPLSSNSIGDQRVVLDDGDGKIAVYSCYGTTGDIDAQWAKVGDVDWLGDEADRITAENIRISSENSRVSVENSRVSAEGSRASVEASRVSAESVRVSSENSRIASENNRVSAESGRSVAESVRVNSENNRISYESIRQSNENARQSAESGRQSAETARVAADTNRTTSVNTMVANMTIIAKTPVANYAAIASTYSSPSNGWTVKTLDDSKIYRYSSATGTWTWVDTITSSSYDNLLAQVASSQRTVSVYNYEPVVTVGKGRNDVNSDVDFASSVVEGTVQGTLNGKTLSNIVQNGNFVSTSNWLAYTGSTQSVTSNVLTNTGSGTSADAFSYQLYPFTSGKKYFVRSIARVTNSNCTYLKMSCSANLAMSVPTPTINQWYPLIGVISSSGEANVNIRHYYVDSTTQNGKAMEVKEVMAIDLTNTGMETWTAAQIDAAIPSWFDATKSAFQSVGGRVRSVGKNLVRNGSGENSTDYWNKKVGTEVVTASSSGISVTTSNSAYGVTQEIRVKKNTIYKISGTIVSGSADIRVYDPTFTSSLVAGGSFNTGNNSTVVVYVRSSAATTFVFKDIQVEEGASITAYEKFKQNETFMALSEPLRRLPNGVKDDVDLSSGVVTRRVKEYTLQASDITAITNGTNLQRIVVPMSKLIGVASISATVGSLNIENIVSISGYDECGGITGYDEIANANKIWTNVDNLLILKPLGTYADLSAAQTALTGTVIRYQLATPTTSVLENFSPVETYKSGTIYIDPYLKKLIKYATASSGLSWATPISAIDAIYKQVGSELVAVDSTLYTLAADGKSVRVYTNSGKGTEVTDGAYYWVHGAVKGEESLIPSLIATYPTNTSATIADMNADLIKIDKNIASMNDELSNIEYTVADAVSNAVDESKIALYNDVPIWTTGQGKDANGVAQNYLPSVVQSPVEVKLEGNTLSNIVTNGNFVGTTGWYSTSSSATLSATNNILSATGNGANSTPNAYTVSNIQSVVGKKVFFRVIARVTNPDCTSITTLVDGLSAGANQSTALSSPSQNTWYNINSITTQPSDVAGNILLKITHNYADATTANGKVMEVKEVMAIDLTNYPELINLTAAEIDARIPSWFDGTKSVNEVQRVRSVGKNLFNINDNVNYYPDPAYTTPPLSVVNGNMLTVNAYTDAFTGRGQKLKLKPNTTYTITADITTNNCAISAHSFNSQFTFATRSSYLIASAILAVGTQKSLTFTTGSNPDVFISFVKSGANGQSVLTNIQLERASSSTTYEPFKSSALAIKSPFSLKSLPNLVKDSVERVDGKWMHTQRIVQLKMNDLVYGATYTSRTNVDSIRYTRPTNMISGSMSLIASIDGIAEYTGTDNDNVANIGKYTTLSTTGFIEFFVAKGTSRATFEASIDMNKSVQYQLATPIVTEIDVDGNAESFSNGTMYIEPYYEKAHSLGIGVTSITLTTPLSSVESIKRLNGTDYVDVTGWTLASDGLSITGLTAGEQYLVKGLISPSYSTVPKTTVTLPINLRTQVSYLSGKNTQLSKELETLEDKQTLANLEFDYRLTVHGI